MASGIAKYAYQSHVNGKPVHWGRVAEDGVPFRGVFDPLLRDAEYENLVARVRYFHWKRFKLKDEKDMAEYADVMDKLTNGLLELVFIQRFDTPDTHYVEWNEVYMERPETPDTTPARR